LKAGEGNKMTPDQIHIGTGGWTFEPWRGTFYPPGLPQARELEFAGQHVTAIEINGTFYRSQSPASFAKWRDAVPEDFVFTVKASRFCTQRKLLGEAGESIARFVNQGIVELGGKLGPILWQLAATKQFEPGDMAAFLALLPASHEGVKLRHAIEPRHESFRDPAFFAMARKAGAAVVYAEANKYPMFEEQTSDFAYARIQRASEEWEAGYSAAELDRLAAQSRKWAEGGRDVHVFFIAGDKVRNPAAAEALIARLDTRHSPPHVMV
jgi:uncharacterized protein YecE (DUF72 family)